MHRLTLLVLSAGLLACQPEQGFEGSLESLLESQPERFATVLNDPVGHRVQIIYTQIDRDADNRPSFRSYSYRLDADEYFYPASTVKLPTAALALEKINRLDIPGLDRDSIMLTGSAADYQTEATVDETSATGLPSVAHYVRKILLVSDNDAFNRLYEFIGQYELNRSMREKGFADTRIIHRLEIALDAAENRWTNPVRFMDAGTVVYDQPSIRSDVNLMGAEPEPLGVAEVVDGELLQMPKDFAEKNAYSLQDLHDTVQVLIFPESLSPERRFELSEDDYRLMRRYLSMYPGESGIAAYREAFNYPEGYVKFLMYGGSEPDIPDNIRIFNKIGDAYGFLTDAAYIVDVEIGVEFLLAATIYTNENRTFNDNQYEYEEIGLPFLRDLGLAIYELERARPREHSPDLSALRDLR